MIVLAFVCAAGGVYAALNGHTGDAAILSSLSILVSLFVLAGRHAPHCDGQQTGRPRTRHPVGGGPNLAGGEPATGSGQTTQTRSGSDVSVPRPPRGLTRPHPRHWDPR